MYKLSLEQNIAPLRSTNFSLNGNNDIIDGVELTKLLAYNNNSNTTNSTNNLINTNLNNNISNKK